MVWFSPSEPDSYGFICTYHEKDLHNDDDNDRLAHPHLDVQNNMREITRKCNMLFILSVWELFAYGKYDKLWDDIE